MRVRRKARIETAASPSLFITWSLMSFLLSLMLVFMLSPEVSAQSTRTFNSQSDCDSVLGKDWKRHGTSKYLYPSDWRLNWDKRKETIEYSKIKAICSKYGLTLPSAYNMKDWLSLQEIARDYMKTREGTQEKPSHAFFLGEYFEGTRIVDTNGDSVETLIIWSSTEPSGDGPKIAIRLEEYPVGSTKYYAKANDVKDNPLDSSMSGRVVCMYPKNSYCFENSYENEEMKKDKLYQEPYFLGRVGESFYLWVNLNPRNPVKEPLEEFCRRPYGTKPPSVEWLSDFSTIKNDLTEIKPFMDELNKKLESMDIFIPNDGQIGFATKDEPVFWNKISNEFVPRGTKVDKDKKPVVQLFSLCIYRFPIETCE